MPQSQPKRETHMSFSPNSHYTFASAISWFHNSLLFRSKSLPIIRYMSTFHSHEHPSMTISNLHPLTLSKFRYIASVMKALKNITKIPSTTYFISRKRSIVSSLNGPSKTKGIPTISHAINTSSHLRL